MVPDSLERARTPGSLTAEGAGPWTLGRVWRDPLLWGALVAALPCWLGLAWVEGLHPDPLWPWHAPVSFILVAGLHPLVEEWVFRGHLQGFFLARPWGPRAWHGLTAANLAVSLAFTGLHFFGHPPLAASLVLLPSLVFGFFRDRHGRLAGPLLLHAGYNTGYFWLVSGMAG